MKWPEWITSSFFVIINCFFALEKTQNSPLCGFVWLASWRWLVSGGSLARSDPWFLPGFDLFAKDHAKMLFFTLSVLCQARSARLINFFTGRGYLNSRCAETAPFDTLTARFFTWLLRNRSGASWALGKFRLFRGFSLFAESGKFKIRESTRDGIFRQMQNFPHGLFDRYKGIGRFSFLGKFNVENKKYHIIVVFILFREVHLVESQSKVSKIVNFDTIPAPEFSFSRCVRTLYFWWQLQGCWV